MRAYGCEVTVHVPYLRITTIRIHMCRACAYKRMQYVFTHTYTSVYIMVLMNVCVCVCGTDAVPAWLPRHMHEPYMTNESRLET